MGNFRSDSRGGFGNRSRPGGRSGGFNRGRPEGRGGFGNRDSGSFERRRPEMHEVTCDKCNKQCEVPFKPTGDRPVLCSDCFRKEGDSGSGSRSHFDSRSSNTFAQAGITQEQFKQINTKLDKILELLSKIEFEEVLDEDEEDSDEDSDEDSEDAEEEKEDSKEK